MIRLLLLVLILAQTPLWAQSEASRLFNGEGDRAYDMSIRGLLLNKLQMSVIGENLANAMTAVDLRTGRPYQERFVVIESDEQGPFVSVIGARPEQPQLHTNQYRLGNNEDTMEVDVGYDNYLPKNNIEMVIQKRSFSASSQLLNTIKNTYTKSYELLE